jgi:flagellar assembly protein FliH
MNMSSSPQVFEPVAFMSNAFFYRDVALPVEEEERSKAIEEEIAFAEAVPPGVPQEEVDRLIALARADAIAETEARLHREMEARAAGQMQQIETAIKAFSGEQKAYFGRVESDVVHLALGIASKILHREAQVDSMLVAALVRVAINQMHDGSKVTVRVAPAELKRWSDYLSAGSNGATVVVVADAHLSSDECVLETEVGSASFGIDAQLKEVERGFFDLIAQRPTIK